MNYLVKIWSYPASDFKKEILFSADNDVIAMQKASAATPDGCRATYEEINKEDYEKAKAKEKQEEQESAVWQTEQKEKVLESKTG